MRKLLTILNAMVKSTLGPVTAHTRLTRLLPLPGGGKPRSSLIVGVRFPLRWWEAGMGGEGGLGPRPPP
jgi:hypothetical protein